MKEQPLATQCGSKSSEPQPRLQHPIADRHVRLRRFRGPVEQRDAEVIERWRKAPAAVHARAMIDLSRYAEQMLAHTGFGKDPNEMFPGFPHVRASGASDGDSPATEVSS